ncbi:hypothetical protein GCM10010435_53940 [Winogradskya consettensis]|uniref:Uncharacterized protein n=1 Tax=Winogradskya consettensis TaxID=113560 RepID=A0A919VQ36_9ACTN|nr:hypothetical protein Aco04nite_25510 [Actinoplanes consettensis]
MPEPITLAEIVDAGRDALRDLLGVDCVPTLDVLHRSRGSDGRLAEGGERRLGRGELEAVRLGGPGVLAGEDEHYEAAVDGFECRIWLWIFRADEDYADDLTELEGRHIAWLECVPARTPVMVVTSIGLALGAARSRGGYFDTQLRLAPELGVGVAVPAERALALTRLEEVRGETYEQACERFLDVYSAARPGGAR